MQARVLTIALALLLLLTQQFGLQHRLAHALRAPAEAGWSPAATAAPAGLAAQAGAAVPAGDELPADSLCQVCLLLAAIALAAWPALLGWRASQPRGPPPALPRAVPRPARAATPYLARAPPAAAALS